jgi:D-alanyl-D-alanine carboxypeptidase
MHASNPEALRHPASLTKIMTLYMLFERLESGKLKLDTPLPVSSHAEDQEPTKLDLEEGQTIKVEDAIKGMITRSANDAAVVVAEAIGGSEEEFARMMTAKAHALGMSKTVYKNANGLPNDSQVTTARDQAVLGRAIQERFPTYYKYFQTRSFVFRGETIGNHNRLLGSVEGVDGIKTGYTRASGFNLVTSVHRGNRYVVAVVLGGASAGSRDARMRQLLSEHVAQASTKRTTAMMAEATAPKVEPKVEAKAEVKIEPKAEQRTVQRTAPPAAQAKSEKDGQRFNLASAESVPVRLEPPAPATIPGSTDPIRPVMVKTLNIKSGGKVQTASAVALPFAGLPRVAEQPKADPATTALAKAEVAPVRAAPAAEAPAPVPAAALAPVAVAPKPANRSGWIIQVGAYPDENIAKQQLSSIKSKASKLLSAADPFTESTSKGGTTYYRARFAGLSENQAEAACKYLKRNDVDCIAIKN